jgi:hypothetical protein
MANKMANKKGPTEVGPDYLVITKTLRRL